MTKAKTSARPRAPLRIGIAARIYAALGALTTLTIVASAVAWLSYDRIHATVGEMVEDKMPTVELVLELSQVGTQSTALAPRFMNVQTVQQRARLTTELDAIEARQFELIRAVGKIGGVDMKPIQKAVDDLSLRINDINDLTGTRLRNAAQMAAAV
ncbi:MAG: hypothetical protein Q8S58_01580, partial [Bosea sp. (in: a-proteobacteria)]|nr:hypothetical protein [Bosea sp. (in: a-proteobacteria)]